MSILLIVQSTHIIAFVFFMCQWSCFWRETVVILF